MASTTTLANSAAAVSDAPTTYVRPRSYRCTPGDTQERNVASLAARGRRAALEAFYGDLFTIDGDAADAMNRVLAGTAPQPFKDAFCETLTALSAMFDHKI